MKKCILACLIVVTPLAAATEIQKRDTAIRIGLFLLSVVTIGLVSSTTYK